MSARLPKRFNTAGPCVPEEHYMLPVLPRLPGVKDMIEGKLYFTIRAPAQSGKTTFLAHLTKAVNDSGEMYALYCSLAALSHVEDRAEALVAIASEINGAMRASDIGTISQKAFKYDASPGMSSPDSKIAIMLNMLCQDLDRGLAVFFDDMDLLTGPGFLSFLAQIRDGFNCRHRPRNNFPASLALAGMRDIRDYVVSGRPGAREAPLGSPFNIVAERMALANFTLEETGRLYRQHTEATGRVFEDGAVERAWRWSEGQPWLVNALARRIVEVKLKDDRSARVTATHVDEAAETLIKRRDTHIRSLPERLKEPRVENVMESVLAGTFAAVSPHDDDSRYCRDLGLLELTEEKRLRPSNPICREVAVRTLTDRIDKFIPVTPCQTWTDGENPLLSGLLAEFQAFWRENADAGAERFLLPKIFRHDEANHVIILFSFLQRALDGGAAVYHEYAEGRGAADLCAVRKGREYRIEIKIDADEPLEDSLAQLSGYLDTAGEKEGWLVIFDQERKMPLDDKFYIKTKQFKNKTIHIFGC
ncbi:MAG: ATP-binding protein [Deltaproteobacteria bacterium]|nr:ATP-binding protein [Deltaproteobacteria bacterium]